jgi:hypothetical protein
MLKFKRYWIHKIVIVTFNDVLNYVQQVNNKEVYDNRTKESFLPKVQLTKLTNKK